MAYFPQVHKGQAFSPSVLEENNIRQALNPALSYNATNVDNNNAPRFTVSVYNATEKVIFEGTAVVFADESEHPVIENIVPCQPYEDSDEKWGVLLSTLNPGEIGEYLVSGIVEVDCSGKGTHVSPSLSDPGVYVVSDTGATVLSYDAETKKAKIVLGVGNAVADTGYNGYFKIVHKGTDELGGAVFEIVNGHDPEGQYCGYTDVPGCESVAKKTFAVYEGSVRVSLEVHAIRDNDENSTLYYKVVFRTDDQSLPGFDSLLIGYAYENGKVEQAYKEDEVWRLRRDWFL